MASAPKGKRAISALRVHQWLDHWDKFEYDPKDHRQKPKPHFYLFSLPASELLALADIQRRTAKKGSRRAADLGIQRRHDAERSADIKGYIRDGFPYSDLSETRKLSGKMEDLKKPGWLPTAIVMNILRPGDKRHGRTVAKTDLIEITHRKENTATIYLPSNFKDSSWQPKQCAPLEIIDGQHRLFAFADTKKASNYELPVVAFFGLDRSWQAYLFWTINIRPKRISPSLAYDLYPLLRAEDWLDRFEGHPVYREVRSQELTEALWLHPESPWEDRINMLGEKRGEEGMPRQVTQAAWIRSLMASFVKASEGPGVKIGGLFGAPAGEDEQILPWNRAQQAAYLIFAWECINEAVTNPKLKWAKILRKDEPKDLFTNVDPAFASLNSLLNTDQGVRATLQVLNDLSFLIKKLLGLDDWRVDVKAGATDIGAVTHALKSLRRNKKMSNFLRLFAEGIAEFDWRTSNAPDLSDLSEAEQTLKRVFRGSGGYSELRRQLLNVLASNKTSLSPVADIARDVLGYTE